MKGFLLITLVALTTTCITALPKCPGENGALLPNPADCHSYYECANGFPVLMECPPKLEWADHLKRCDFPEVAKCTETETEIPTTIPPPTEPTSTKPEYPTSTKPEYPTTSLPRPTECPAEDDPAHDVLLPNPDDCGSFFKCLNGIPHLILCPPGQEWSIELNRCDYPEIAHCQKSFGKKIALGFNLRKDDRCPAEDGEQDVLLANPNDCTTFYKCNNGELIIQDCPGGLHWNDEAKYCDYPLNAGCQKALFFARNEWPTECPAENGVYDFFLPNLEDCTTYFKCDNGRKFLMECPVGTLWDAPMQRCDHTVNARCA